MFSGEPFFGFSVNCWFYDYALYIYKYSFNIVVNYMFVISLVVLMQRRVAGIFCSEVVLLLGRKSTKYDLFKIVEVQ